MFVLMFMLTLINIYFFLNFLTLTMGFVLVHIFIPLLNLINKIFGYKYNYEIKIYLDGEEIIEESDSPLDSLPQKDYDESNIEMEETGSDEQVLKSETNIIEEKHIQQSDEKNHSMNKDEDTEEEDMPSQDYEAFHTITNPVKLKRELSGYIQTLPKFDETGKYNLPITSIDKVEKPCLYDETVD